MYLELAQSNTPSGTGLQVLTDGDQLDFSQQLTQCHTHTGNGLSQKQQTRVSGSPDVACHKHSKSQWVSGCGLSQTQQESMGLRMWPVTNTARGSGSPDVACHKHSRQQSVGLWMWPVTNTADSSQRVSGSGLSQTQQTAVSGSPFAGSVECLTESGLPQTLQTKIREGEAGSLYQFNQIK